MDLEGLGDRSLCRYLAEELTSTRDQLSLSHCLSEILQKLFSPKSFCLYELKSQSGGRPELGESSSSMKLLNVLSPLQEPLMLGALEGAQEAVKSALAVEIVLANGVNRLIQPVKGTLGVQLLIVLEGYNYKSEAKNLIGNLATIFGNLNLLLMQSERDALTGLLNRQAFARTMAQVHLDLENIYRRQQDHGEGSFFAMLDLDFFKSINDTYGHLHGDEVLLSFARLMESTFRHSDYLFRYGGEEFVVILTNVSSEDAKAVLERFREKVQANLFPQVGEVTVSIGMTEIDANLAISSIIEQADRALYYVKEHGRNQLAAYEDLIKKGSLKPVCPPEVDVDLF
jgi:diguanylate cyclase (GGDEF)-like protein